MFNTLNLLISRNIKLYFKDKGTFLMSLISPLIIFLLFITFLKGVYEDSFLGIFPPNITVSENIASSFTVCWLMSSIVAVSSVTVAFCSNIIMIQDKINGSINDLLVAPIKKSLLGMSYFIANFIATLIICYIAIGVGFIYIALTGWYFSVSDVFIIIGNTTLCVLFGTTLSSLIDGFLSTQGSMAAVSTLVSALYGFVCGAYMPTSQFSKGIRTFISFLPGTYTTGLMRDSYLNGIVKQMKEDNIPDELITGIRDGFDANLYFMDERVENWQMYVIVGSAILVLLICYIIVNKIQSKKHG